MVKLKALLTKIKTYEKQRKIWMSASTVFAAFLCIVIFEIREIIESHNIPLWVMLLTILVTTSAIWWYWTMNVLKNVLAERHDEVELLIDIIKDIKSIKDEVIKSQNKY